MVHNKSQKGFTLIELLVVVAIISLLTTVILAALGDSKEKAAWRAFDSEILEIQKAVQLYKVSNNGDWPPIMSVTNVDAIGGIASFLSGEDLLGSDSVTIPTTGQWRFGAGYLTNSTEWYSCGDDHRDVYYVLYHAAPSSSVSTMGSNRSLLFKQFYRRGSIFSAGRYSCFEFR